MSGDTTYGALERLTHMPDREDDKQPQGDRIAGQFYYDVDLQGGSIANVTLTDVTINGVTTSRTETILTEPGDYTVQSDDYIITVNKTVPEATVITLPIDPVASRSIIVKDGQGEAGDFNITIDPNGKLIDSLSSFVLAADWAAVEIVYNGTEWNVLNAYRDFTTAGTVIGPTSSTDNAIVRFDGLTGQVIQNSGVVLSDTNVMTMPAAGQILLDDSVTTVGANLPIAFDGDTDTGFFRPASNQVDIAAGGVSIIRAQQGTATGLRALRPIYNAYGSNIASATTPDLGAATGNTVQITGTTTITGFGATPPVGATFTLWFSGILTLTHNATSFILPNNGSNIVTAVGDRAVFTYEGSSNWRCMLYQRADGTALSAPAANLTGSSLPSGITGSSLTSVGTIGTGTWQGNVIAGQYGGTGVANTGRTITIGGNLTHSGSFTQTFIATGNTSVTLPTSGTLATLAGSEALTNKSVNGVTLVAGGSATLWLNQQGNYTSPTTVVPDADYGDITVSSSGTVWTIDNSAVTNAKMANMTQATIKGRASGAGTGAPVDLTATEVAAILSSSNVARERLTANRTYYVRTDGSDSNNGLTNTSGGAFLTINKAINVAADTLDPAGYTVTIQVADGTYTTPVVLRPLLGGYTLNIRGNNSTPSNVIINTTSNSAIITAEGGVNADLRDFRIQTTTSGVGLYVTAGVVAFRNLVFGSTVFSQITVEEGGIVRPQGSYSIVGGASAHIQSTNGGLVKYENSPTVTLTGTPAFSAGFAYMEQGGCLRVSSVTFSGSATGSRYFAGTNSVIATGGGGANYLPGSVAGSTATGGQYS